MVVIDPAPKLALSVNEACKAASIGRNLLYREIGSGRLPIVKIGKRTLITAQALNAWLDGASRPTKAA